MTLINDSIPHKEVSSVHNKSNPLDGQDILLVLFVYFMQIVNTQQDTAHLAAKKLKENASMEVQLNNENKAINLVSIPNVEKIYETKWVQGKTVVEHNGGWEVRYHTADRQVRVTVGIKNHGAIEAAQSENQQREKMRQGIASKLAVLNQLNGKDQTSMRNDIEQAQQSISEGTGLLSMMKAITKKIESK